VDFHGEGGEDNSARQEALIGKLCIAYGAFVTVLMLIPNPLLGRLSFLVCGGIVLLIGIGLLRKSHRTLARVPV
jgi:SSS family solute:Na+ symporter